MNFFVLCIVVVLCDLVCAEDPIKYFLRDMNTTVEGRVTMQNDKLKELAGFTHYRLVPGDFSYGKYHFDGLATVMKFSFETNSNGDMEASYFAKPYESEAYQDKDNHKCVFFGTGIGPFVHSILPTGGVCFLNPGVNLLPINGELWLTIDTASWGRVDADTLETIQDAKAEVNSLVLNAHPACDRKTGECYVQHPCPEKSSPDSKDVCFSILEKDENGNNLKTTIVSKQSLDSAKIIQHSHSPCITQNYVVSKLDAFVFRDPLTNHNGGLLKYAHQGEDDEWLVMNRNTNESVVMKSAGHSFVNNHFWNCVENENGDVVVETVTATQDYLDNYFDFNLAKMPKWNDLFHDPLKCVIPKFESQNNATTQIQCDGLLSADSSITYFDYPTFNPEWKMNPSYRYFYAIAPKDTSTSRWFDSVVKIDRTSSKDVASFSDSGLYFTEADFIPLGGDDEDDGVLLTIAYNSTSDESLLIFLDAKDLTVLSSSSFGFVIPFHAHGISCAKDQACWTNP